YWRTAGEWQVVPNSVAGKDRQSRALDPTPRPRQPSEMIDRLTALGEPSAACPEIRPVKTHRPHVIWSRQQQSSAGLEYPRQLRDSSLRIRDMFDGLE